MIGSLKGCVTGVYAPFILLEVNGIGYEVETPVNTFCTLNIGDQLSLWTHLVVREDAQLLYGFTTQIQKQVFQTLIKVNGVGAKMAIAILSSIDIISLKNAVSNDDISRLIKIPGIGKKTAERLVIELRDKLDQITVTSTDHSNADDSGSVEMTNRLAITEAVSALKGLGYSPKEAEKVVNSVKGQGNTTQALIRLSLKSLAV